MPRPKDKDGEYLDVGDVVRMTVEEGRFVLAKVIDIEERPTGTGSNGDVRSKVRVQPGGKGPDGLARFAVWVDAHTLEYVDSPS